MDLTVGEFKDLLFNLYMEQRENAQLRERIAQLESAAKTED